MRSPLRTALLMAAAASAHCTRGEAPSAACIPGALRCVDGAAEVCADDGSGFVAAACPAHQVCVAGTCDDPAACPDRCRDRICTPGQRFCGQADHDRHVVYECDQTGTEPLPCGTCAGPPFNGVCYQGDCVPTCDIEKKSYIGCEYYAVDLDNAFVYSGFDGFGNPQFLDAQNAQFAVVVSNPDYLEPAFVLITKGPIEGSAPGVQCSTDPISDQNFVTTLMVPPRGSEVVNLPAGAVNGTVKTKDDASFRIGANRPITVNQFNPLENVDVFSNDASVLLPTQSMGQSYMIMTRGQTFDTLKGYLAVVGINPSPTQVTVKVTAKTLPGIGIPGLVAGDEFSTTLERFEVLAIATNAIGADLTGSTVEASQPVVVFGGSEAANAPSTSRCDLSTMTCFQDPGTACACTPDDGPLCTPDSKCSQFITCCADHLEQQLLPIDAWGTEYVAVRSARRGTELDVWRFLAQANDTTITLVPPVHSIPTLSAGEWYEIESDADFVITSSQPIMVGQFLAAEHAPNPGRQLMDAGIGDPAFITAVPLRQFRTDYAILAPPKYKLDYLSVAVRSTSSVTLDNVNLRGLGSAEVVPVGSTGWQAIRVPLADGFHEVMCGEPCGIMVHGYDSYVSYGYPGGLDLESEDEEE